MGLKPSLSSSLLLAVINTRAPGRNRWNVVGCRLTGSAHYFITVTISTSVADIYHWLLLCFSKLGNLPFTLDIISFNETQRKSLKWINDKTNTQIYTIEAKKKLNRLHHFTFSLIWRILLPHSCLVVSVALLVLPCRTFMHITVTCCTVTVTAPVFLRYLFAVFGWCYSLVWVLQFLWAVAITILYNSLNYSWLLPSFFFAAVVVIILLLSLLWHSIIELNEITAM